MRYVGAFSPVAASLIGSTLLGECANAQSNSYALDPLLLMPSDKQPLYARAHAYGANISDMTLER